MELNDILKPIDIKFNFSMYNLRLIKKMTDHLFTWEIMNHEGVYKYSATFTDNNDGRKYKVTIEEAI